MELAEARGIKVMYPNKGQPKIQESLVYQAEERFSRARELFKLQSTDNNIVQNALMSQDEISPDEMQREKPSPYRREQYSLLHHYPDYPKRFCEAEG